MDNRREANYGCSVPKEAVINVPIPKVKIFPNFRKEEILETIVNSFIEQTCPKSLRDLQFKTNIDKDGRLLISAFIIYTD